VGKEGTEMLKLFTNWKMLLVLPAAWTSNFFYTYQFATSCRKRGLGSLLSLCLALPFGEEAANQLRYKDGQWQEDLIDFKDGRRYAGPFLLFSSYGILDAMFQSLVYWIIGALANDSQILSR
jgi:hypothetical protein